jgi:hypothetical protein
LTSFKKNINISWSERVNVVTKKSMATILTKILDC